MRMEFTSRPGGPERLVCDAELVFDEVGPLEGMKLVGFTLWRSTEGEVYVTFPSRSYGAGGDRRYYDFLRSVEASAKTVAQVKAWILEQWTSRQRAA
jgi:hypothetical protein